MNEATYRIEALDITDRFMKATEEVCSGRGDLRKRIDKTLNQLLNNPAAPGLHRHPIKTTRLKELSSSRVTDSVRLIDQQADTSRLIALHVGTHDPSYELAQRIQGGQLRVVITMQRQDESNCAAHSNEMAATNAFDRQFAQARTIPPAGPGKESFDVIPLKDLIALGLPDAIARRVRAADPNTAWDEYGLADYADRIETFGSRVRIESVLLPEITQMRRYRMMIPICRC